MAANFYKRYNQMMDGGIVNFTEHEVFDLLAHMDYFHINTLKIQSCGEKPTKLQNGLLVKLTLKQLDYTEKKRPLKTERPSFFP